MVPLQLSKTTPDLLPSTYDGYKENWNVIAFYLRVFYSIPVCIKYRVHDYNNIVFQYLENILLVSCSAVY